MAVGIKVSLIFFLFIVWILEKGLARSKTRKSDSSQHTYCQCSLVQLQNLIKSIFRTVDTIYVSIHNQRVDMNMQSLLRSWLHLSKCNPGSHEHILREYRRVTRLSFWSRERWDRVIQRSVPHDLLRNRGRAPGLEWGRGDFNWRGWASLDNLS